MVDLDRNSFLADFADLKVTLIYADIHKSAKICGT